mmetsp:Transcript_974/g.2467  ORF Transcript_974/g.2467 Transcript_974/m.2467 type:complete len:240 (-) Transcript_974:296-1015(-)
MGGDDTRPGKAAATAAATRAQKRGGAELRALAREVDAVDHPDAPEVLRELLVAHVLVGHEEIPLATPRGSPRVADDEALRVVVVADAHDCVAAHDVVRRLGHGHLARRSHLLRHEGAADDEAEDKGEAVVEATLEVLQGLRDAGVLLDAILQRLGVAPRGRPLCKLIRDVRPHRLRAHAELGADYATVAHGGAGVLVDGVLASALVVVDEEPGALPIRDLLLDLAEVDGGRDGVGGATP